MAPITISHIELRDNQRGLPRAFIAGTRVRVQDIYGMSELRGLTPDQIVAALPHLTLGQVHAALSYYFDHRDQVLQEMRDDEGFVQEVRRAVGPGPLARKLGIQGESV